MMMAEKFMQGAVKHPGYLHTALHVPQGEKIPAARVEAAAHSVNPHLAKAANLAKVFAQHRPHNIDGNAHKRLPPHRKMAHHHQP